MTTAATRLLALLGRPVAHSRSPAMMTFALERLGIDAAYVACDVAPERLADAVRGLLALGAAGANVTIPHKRAALALADARDGAAAAVGAANTLAFAGGRIAAHNTDAPGAIAALCDAGVDVRGQTVAVLGAGGAARAVAVGAALAGAAEVVLLARRVEAAREIAAALVAAAPGCAALALGMDEAALAGEAFARAAVAVQATSVGMARHGTGGAAATAEPGEADALARMTDWLTRMPRGGCAMDLVYVPRETAWLRAARAAGLQAVDGLGMLAHQGALALGHWFGITAPAEVLRRFLDESQPAE